jgi:phosphate transport system substrate-binding protein
MRERRNYWVFLCAGALLAAGVACDSDRHGRQTRAEKAASGEGEDKAKEGTSQSLTIKGSDTMVILAQKWAERFMKNNSDKTLQVSGGGSGTGIAALINGTTDIANASRQMKDSEKKQLKNKQGKEAVATPVALDAIAVYVHKDNEIESVTVPELRKIYRGKITNWSKLGGPDKKIILYGRQNNSGTYAYFKEHVLDNMDFARKTQTLPGTSAVINAVSKDVGGIGYGGIGYAEGVRTVPLAPKGDKPVEPTMKKATSGEYPLARKLYVYTAGEPTGLAKQYIDFTLSKEGQKLVKGVGYYPLKDIGGGEQTGAAKEDKAKQQSADKSGDESAETTKES